MISHSFTHVIRQYYSDIQTRINLKKALMPNTVPNPWHTYKPDGTVGHTLFRIADESRFKIHIWMHCSHWLQINEMNIWPLKERKKERKIIFFICHIHNYTEYNQEWNVFSAFNPSKYTHTWSSGQSGEQLEVRCLAQGSHLSRGQFLLEPRFKPTTLAYKSNVISIRPRLPTAGEKYAQIKPGLQVKTAQKMSVDFFTGGSDITDYEVVYWLEVTL